MTNSADAIVHEVVDITDAHFGARRHAVCVYGSFASGCTTSDLDLFVAADDPTREDMLVLQEGVVGAHKRHELRLDDEVPYENKLLASYQDVGKAVLLQGLDVSTAAIRIPPIEKTAEFLSSYSVRLRLLFNALTTPNIVIARDDGSLESAKDVAERSLLILAINNVRSTRFTVHELIVSLLKSEAGDEGEMFLGYKEEEPVLSHLKRILSEKIGIFLQDGTLARDGGHLTVERDAFRKKIAEMGEFPK